MRAMESIRRKLEASERKDVLKTSGPKADFIRSIWRSSGAEDHHELEDWGTSSVVQMKIESRLSLQKIGRIEQWLSQMDLRALDAYLVESTEKGHLYEVYNHYLHYSVFMSTSTRTTVVPATVFL